MLRRVGSPKASVMADTVAVNEALLPMDGDSTIRVVQTPVGCRHNGRRE
jgi:hypothetical protein